MPRRGGWCIVMCLYSMVDMFNFDSAIRLSGGAKFQPMSLASLPEVVQVEERVFDDPWPQSAFQLAIERGYLTQLLAVPMSNGTSTMPQHIELIGYFVAVKEMTDLHLLKITVAPGYQCRGWARIMLDALVLWSRNEGIEGISLDVRRGNFRAQALYHRYGFHLIGKRNDYYESHVDGQREESLAMRLTLLTRNSDL
jgi:[ribosomal protein S18]-alanine N-acetyltransferase